MKKTVFAMMAALMLSTGAFAQDGQFQGQRRERRQIDKTEMIQRRTDATVKKYGLSDDQAQKLLKLNTEYADKMPAPRFGGQRGPRQGGQNGPRAGRQRMQNDSLKAMDRPSRRDRGEMSDEAKKRIEEMQKTREEYDAELQKIMTEEQFKSYKQDQEQRMNRQR